MFCGVVVPVASTCVSITSCRKVLDREKIFRWRCS